jgi:hypothetical protein
MDTLAGSGAVRASIGMDEDPHIQHVTHQDAVRSAHPRIPVHVRHGLGASSRRLAEVQAVYGESLRMGRGQRLGVPCDGSVVNTGELTAMTKQKRGYSREFTPKTERRVRFEVDRIPPTLYEAVAAKAKRTGVSLRALTLTLWKEWLERP